MKTLFTALMLLVAVDASAQSLKKPVLTFAVAAGADWVTTYRNLADGHGIENNPLLKPMQKNAKAVVIVGAAIDVAGTVAWYRLMRNHRKLANIGMFVSAAFRIKLAVHNARLYNHR